MTFQYTSSTTDSDVVTILVTLNRPKRLSTAFVKIIASTGRYGDGRGGLGLSLLVKPASYDRTSKS